MSFDTQVFHNIPNITITSKHYNEVVQKHNKLRFSLKSVAKNLHNNNHLYTDKVSKLHADLGSLSNPIVSNGLPLLTCIVTFISVIAIALSLHTYCKV